MIRRVLLVNVPLIIVMTASVYAANPVEIIRRAEQAGKTVSYRGIKVASVYFGGRYTTSTLKVLHKSPDRTRTDFFSPASIAGCIVIQNGDHVWTFSPASDMWEHRSPSIRVTPDRLQPDLATNYDLRLVGRDHVAGRPTYIIHALPHNRHEAARRLWVDESSHLIIKSQIEDMHGKVLNSSHYTTIEIDPSDISLDAFRVTGKIASSTKPGALDFRAILPKYLPSGYKLIATSTITVNAHSCAHMQFSNGTNVISLFERQADDAHDKSPSPLKSKVTNVLTWTNDGMTFTLIADISSKELTKIAESMR